MSFGRLTINELINLFSPFAKRMSRTRRAMRNIRKDRKMTLDQYCRNLRGSMKDGTDPPRSLLAAFAELRRLLCALPALLRTLAARAGVPCAPAAHLAICAVVAVNKGDDFRPHVMMVLFLLAAVLALVPACLLDRRAAAGKGEPFLQGPAGLSPLSSSA